MTMFQATSKVLYMCNFKLRGTEIEVQELTSVLLTAVQSVRVRAKWSHGVYSGFQAGSAL